jgi:1,4-alpha-glucan branching enzyme
MMGHPGKKLLFMGNELGQWSEWNHDSSIEWDLLEYPLHKGLQRWVRDLNTLYRGEAALHELDSEREGFEWIDCNDTEASVVTFLRHGRNAADTIVFACNFTPVPRHNYLVGVPASGRWKEILNSDAKLYGGSGQGNMGGVGTVAVPEHGRPCALNLTAPPLGVVAFKWESA